MKYRPIFEELHDQRSAANTADAVPEWLNTSCNSPSHFEPSPHFTTSPHASPPATPPHLRKRRKQRHRWPLQPSNDNQNPSPKPSLKRKMADRNGDTMEQSGRQLREKDTLKPPVRYQEEQQGSQGQRAREELLWSPHKRSKNEGVAVAPGRGLGRGLAQSAFKPSVPDPTTPITGRGRGSGTPGRRQQSPTKSSHASDRMGWMARLEPGVRFLTPEECLKQRKVPHSARTLWLDYIRSDTNEYFIPDKFGVSNSILVL